MKYEVPGFLKEGSGELVNLAILHEISHQYEGINVTGLC